MTTLPADAAGERALEPHETYVHEHHWRNAQDEAEGCKFGMWLFLSTEVLLFAGFFCAYAAFRMLYYDTWRYASMDYLSWKVGLANTIVLLFSSFTVVMAIRETQLARKWRAVFFLGLTNACAIFFLVTKLALEYAPERSVDLPPVDPTLVIAAGWGAHAVHLEGQPRACAVDVSAENIQAVCRHDPRDLRVEAQRVFRAEDVLREIAAHLAYCRRQELVWRKFERYSGVASDLLRCVRGEVAARHCVEERRYGVLRYTESREL